MLQDAWIRTRLLIQTLSKCTYMHMYMHNVYMCVIMTNISKSLHNVVSLAAPDDMEMYSGMCGR